MKRLFLLLLIVSLGCEKETDLISEKIHFNISFEKVWESNTQFTNPSSGKACEFPPTLDTGDSSTYYLRFESIDTGEVQTVTIVDGLGSFDLSNFGDQYKLTASTFDGTVLPDYSNSYYWYSEQIVDYSISRSIEVVLENPYSAIVVVQNENSIAPTPTIAGVEMYTNDDGWFIFTKVEGVEPVRIPKSDGTIVSLDTAYEPTMIFTYMYCDPLSISIAKQTAPFTVNNRIVIN